MIMESTVWRAQLGWDLVTVKAIAYDLYHFHGPVTYMEESAFMSLHLFIQNFPLTGVHLSVNLLLKVFINLLDSKVLPLSQNLLNTILYCTVSCLAS